MKKIRIGIFGILLTGMILTMLTPTVSQAAAKKQGLSKTKLSMAAGKHCKLSVRNRKGYSVSWKSSKKTVASVSKTGNVVAKKKGTAKITAVVKPKESGKTYRFVCRVSVTRPEENHVSRVKPETEDTSRATESLDEGSDDTIDENSNETKLLYGNYQDGLYREGREGYFGNRILSSYVQLQELIQDAKKEQEKYQGQNFSNTAMQQFIDQLEKLDSDYFETNVLCINTMSVARGYAYTLDLVQSVINETGQQELNITLNRRYNLGKDECVTCDLPYYTWFIQIPKEQAAGCDVIVCQITETVVVQPPADTDLPEIEPDVIWIIQKQSYER